SNDAATPAAARSFAKNASESQASTRRRGSSDKTAHRKYDSESFVKTLKAEEVNGKPYATLDHARRDIGAFIETVYNAQRLHSALGYKPPVEFEAELSQTRNRQPQAEVALSPN